MNKSCINCKFSKANPTKKCACTVSVTHELSLAEPMKFNGSGFQYCDAFKPLRKEVKRGI